MALNGKPISYQRNYLTAIFPKSHGKDFQVLSSRGCDHSNQANQAVFALSLREMAEGLFSKSGAPGIVSLELVHRVAPCYRVQEFHSLAVSLGC